MGLFAFVYVCVRVCVCARSIHTKNLESKALTQACLRVCLRVCVSLWGLNVWHYRKSGGWRCAFLGVPWRGSVSARLAWGDFAFKPLLQQVLKRLRAGRTNTECTLRSCCS